MSPSLWPARVADPDGRLVLRALEESDGPEFVRLREDNRAYLAPWEPTSPAGSPVPVTSVAAYVVRQRREALEGSLVPFCVELDGRLVGQVHIGDVVAGSQLSGAAGYWVARNVSGRGVGTRAVALALDWALTEGGLHRVEVNVRVDNAPSLALVAAIGLRHEGVRVAYLHVAGAWRDHHSFAITREELPVGGLVSRVRPLR